MAIFGSDWMFDRPRRSNEPVFGGLQRAPVTDWNPEDRARVWQEPEDGRHPGGAMRDPVQRASAVEQRGLFDSDEDLQAYLARMTQPGGLPVNAGYSHTFSPGVQARINAEVQPQTTGLPTVTPSIGATLGPLSLDGGLRLQQATNEQGNSYTQASSAIAATPTLGAGLKVPLFDGTAELKAKYTPEQIKMLNAEWKKKIFNDTGELSLYGNYAQPAGDARPDWGFGIRGRIPF